MPAAASIAVISYTIGEDRYVLIVHPGQESHAYKQLGRWAADKRHPFSWRDAAIVSRTLQRDSHA